MLSIRCQAMIWRQLSTIRSQKCHKLINATLRPRVSLAKWPTSGLLPGQGIIRGFAKDTPFKPVRPEFESKRVKEKETKQQEKEKGKEKEQEKEKEKEKDEEELSFDEELAQMGLWQRYKKLGKEYWYIMIPVHYVTSVLWFGSFYLLSSTGTVESLVIPVLRSFGVPDKILKGLKEGWDIFPLLETIHCPQSIVDFMKKVSKQTIKDIAVSLAFYKILTPLRYMATIGCTIPSIKFLVRRELIKPVPSRARLRKMLKNKMAQK